MGEDDPHSINAVALVPPPDLHQPQEGASAHSVTVEHAGEQPELQAAEEGGAHVGAPVGENVGGGHCSTSLNELPPQAPAVHPAYAFDATNDYLGLATVLEDNELVEGVLEQLDGDQAHLPDPHPQDNGAGNDGGAEDVGGGHGENVGDGGAVHVVDGQPPMDLGDDFLGLAELAVVDDVLAQMLQQVWEELGGNDELEQGA